MQYHCYEIDYDTDGEVIPDLPTELTVEYEGEDPACELADAISDQTGFCVNSFQYEVVAPNPGA